VAITFKYIVAKAKQTTYHHDNVFGLNRFICLLLDPCAEGIRRRRRRGKFFSGVGGALEIERRQKRDEFSAAAAKSAK
jgi:hypothetical protein